MPNDNNNQNNRPPVRVGGPRGGGHGHGPMGGFNGEKAKNSKQSFKKLMSFMKAYKKSMLVVIIFTALSTVGSILGPYLLGKITTSVAESAGTSFMTQSPIEIAYDTIIFIAILLLVLHALSALFNFIQGKIVANVSQKMTYNLRESISKKMSKLPLKYYDQTPRGDILSRITNDVDTISNSLQQGVSQAITSVLSIIGFLVMMLYISPLMTLIAIVTVPLSGILVALIVKFSQKHFRRKQRHLGELNGHVEEIFSGHNVIKAYNLENKSINEFNKINNEFYKAEWKSHFLSGLMQPLMQFVGNLGYVGVCVFGGYLAINHGFAVGGIQSFMQYIRRFNQPIAQTAQISNLFQSTMAASERVFEFLDAEEEVKETDKPVKLPEIKGDVDLQNVTFGYTEEKTILTDINVKVKAGQTVAIVGPTGAGKTTIINLLMRFYDVNSGSIKIDGVDIKDMKRADLRKIFGMVLQDTWLFSGTVKENLAYGNLNASDEEIKAAAEAAYCTHFINIHPDGYNMEINEEASNISQGQKQLLTIARAILANPPILILDEATSSVDTRTEQRIQKAMNNLMKGRTSFVIAHRLSTIKDADIILVMKDGNIIEQGSHDVLMEKKGFYCDLYNSQFEKVS